MSLESIASQDTRLISVAALTSRGQSQHHAEQQMQFSVIYSVDCPEDEDISRFARLPSVYGPD